MANTMASHEKTNATRYPNLIGAGLMVGLLVGAAVGGASGNFDVWVPVLGIAGVLLGLALKRFA